jgi:hypothetical protein
MRATIIPPMSDTANPMICPRENEMPNRASDSRIEPADGAVAGMDEGDTPMRARIVRIKS